MAKAKTLQIAPETAAPADAGRPKTVCPLSKAEFLKAARPISVTVDGQTMAANPKEFSTGSFGYYARGKVTLTLGGVPVTFQVGLNVIAVGSAPAKA